ncbi:MAG: sulfotransferase [Chloroflexi bacterium]|nr:sulfotransferase [Chloroflexota bacterium]
MPHRIIVLGILRSGTSLTAELVRRWGAYAGGKSALWQADVNGPRGYLGYMEYIPLQDFNDKLLDNNDRVPARHEMLEKKALEPELREEALELISNMDHETAEQSFDTWIWKDARLPLTIPFWENIWEDVIYVIPVRHPVETILSAAKIEGMEADQVPLSAGFAYWQFSMLNTLLFTEKSSRKIFIAYDQLLQNPQRESARLCQFLDAQCGRSSENSEERIDFMAAQVSASQRHFNHPKSLAEIDTTTREQRALYNFLRIKTMYPDEAFNPNDFALYSGWQEYLQAMDALVSMMQSQENQR